MITKTSSSEFPMLSKLTVLLYGLLPSTQNEPTGQTYPLCDVVPHPPSDVSHGISVPLTASQPPQNWKLPISFNV